MIVLLDGDGEFLGVFDTTPQRIKLERKRFRAWWKLYAEKIENGNLPGLQPAEWLKKVGIKKLAVPELML